MIRNTFEQFDFVSIITTTHVTWMIDLPGQTPDPNGVWTVVCCFPQSGTLLVSKDTAMCRIPASHVRKIANYNVKKVYESIDGVTESILGPGDKRG